MRAAQRRAQAARSAAGNRSGAARGNRTGAYPMPPMGSNAPQDSFFTDANPEQEWFPAQPQQELQRPYARSNDPFLDSAAQEQAQQPTGRRVGRRTAYQQQLAKKQQENNESNEW